MRGFNGELFDVDWFIITDPNAEPLPMAQPFGSGFWADDQFDIGDVGEIPPYRPQRSRAKLPDWVCRDCYCGDDEWWESGWPDGTPPVTFRDGFATCCEPSPMPVKSVGLAMPTEFQVSNSPVTFQGTLTADWKSAGASLFLATPALVPGVPSLRAIALTDLPPIPAGPVIYCLDIFHDLDGVPLASHVMDVGTGWTVVHDFFTIIAGAAQSTVGATSPTGPVAVTDTGHSDFTVQGAVQINSPGNGNGIIFRYQSLSAFWVALLVPGSGVFQLYEVVGGTFTLRASTAFNSGTEENLIRVVANGSSITCTCDDTATLTYTSTSLMAETKVGLRGEWGPIGDRWSSFCASSIPIPWGNGTMTSIIFSGSSVLSITGKGTRFTPTVDIQFSSQAAHKFFRGPLSGLPAAPTFDFIDPSDVPSLPASVINTASGAFNVLQIPNLDGSIIASGTIGATFIPALPYVSATEANGIAAAGTTQGTATVITATNNAVTTCTVGVNDGIILTDGTAKVYFISVNTGGSAVKVYPPVGHKFYNGATNAPVTQPSDLNLRVYMRVGATQWYRSP